MSRSGRHKAPPNSPRNSEGQLAVGEPAAGERRGTALACAVSDGTARVRQLGRRVNVGVQEGLLLTNALRRIAGTTKVENGLPLPLRLTVRARRLLERGRELLSSLRKTAEELSLLSEPAGAVGLTGTEPLVRSLRQTIAMAEVALRVVQAMPDTPGEQLALSEGLGAILADAARRGAALTAAVASRRQGYIRVSTLAQCLLRMSDGGQDDGQVTRLADGLVEDARRAAPLCFHDNELVVDQPPEGSALESREAVARLIACHSLITAQVGARLLGRDPEWADRPAEAVLAALVHDVGMLQVPAQVLGSRGTLDMDARRSVEAHARAGAAAVARAFPGADWLAGAVAGHHERLDGTGYPDGKKGREIPSLGRLLAVCDVYAALCQDRPHRPAKDTRTALADTLFLAEQGLLDAERAEWLLGLSFYPVGSAVEFGDGSVGVVVATHMGRRDEKTVGRPVVALLADSSRRPFAAVRHVDVNGCDGAFIARGLTPEERRELVEDFPAFGAIGWVAPPAE